MLGGGAAGGGKMLPLDSKVCTPTGFKYLRDIKVGDLVTNPITGGAQEVSWLHPLENHHFYRIHFIDGTYTDCSEGHLWNVHQAGKRTKRTDLEGNRMNERTKPTKWIFDWMEKHKQGSYKGRSLIIPLTAPVKFAISTAANRENIIEPYVLGALIGDGCVTGKYPMLTTADQEIVDKFKEGDVIKGTINKITSFGAFINIYPGVEALLPSAEMEPANANPFNLYNVGDEIEVLIKKFTPQEHRIALSVKDIQK